jgi:hypothetical protein
VGYPVTSLPNPFSSPLFVPVLFAAYEIWVLYV